MIRWWGEPDKEPAELNLHDPRLTLWIAAIKGRPFAFVQEYCIADWTPHHFDDLPHGSRGLDLYIGEPDLLGAGHGSRLLRQHVDSLFADGVPAAGIDPHPENLRAQRAFAKAGFIATGGAVETRWGRAILMRRWA